MNWMGLSIIPNSKKFLKPHKQLLFRYLQDNLNDK